MQRPTFDPDLRAALVAMVRKRVPACDVEDIVQATLAEAFGGQAPVDPESQRRWLFGVAKHKIADYHRRAGRETDVVPDVPAPAAPHAEADLLRWAEQHLPEGDENKKTLDWMLREGDGEKLETIAEAENLPPPRVRQRVSRLRRHLKDHWQREVARLALVGIVLGTAYLLLRRPEPPSPIVIEPAVPRGEHLRKLALGRCRDADFRACIEGLDEAKRVDPAGDARQDVQDARKSATEALTPKPLPTVTPPTMPAPSVSSAPKVAPPSKFRGKPSNVTEPIPTSGRFPSEKPPQ
jgi:DNA-directed RNA polymerase specialized sigma24 family protein